MRARAHQLGLALLAGVALIAIAVLATGSPAAPRHRGAPEEVTTSSDPGKAKLDDALRQKVDAGATESVPVFVTASADVSRVESLLSADHTAQARGTAIVVGRIPAQAVPKLASLKGVVSVGLVQLKKTGQPLGDRESSRRPSKAQLQAAMREQARGEVPYSKAPPLRGSHFEQLKRLEVMDAKTHRFADAWRAGYTGEGSTVGVLDGGTDFGHPDLIGTWTTWSGATDDPDGFTDDGWNGWPKAFDPFDTLVWLTAPEFVAQGLSWYTPTSAATCGGARNCRVTFATRTGPARNSGVPSGTASHTYKFPRGWTKSGTVRLGSHPDEYLLELYEERPAFLVVDSKQAGVYDTVYVDLDDDHSFADEKPVTKSSPASYRDMNGDGLTDRSGGLLYFISDGETRLPGGLTQFFGTDTPVFGPGAMLAWSGDYDPGIEGHGTLTASNVVGQAVINGKSPRFDDLPGDGRVPGAVLGGAPRAKLAPYGDIYFGFEFSTQFGYFLSTVSDIDITSNSYGESDVDNDGYDAASQEADILHAGTRTTPIFSSGNGAPGFGTTTPPSPFAGIKVGASTQYGATGWDSLAKIREAPDNDVSNWSDRGPGATGSPGIDLVADGAYSSGDLTLNAALDGDVAWETWGGTSRSTPVVVGAAALVYQAYRKAHGGSLPANFSQTAKRVLKSSAKDLGYDGFIQGAGSLDAEDAVKSASGSRATVSPSEWRAGDYRGTEYPVFTHVMAPGASDTQTFSLDAPGTWSVSDRYLRRTDRQKFDFTTSSVAKESDFNFNSPDYLMDISNAVNRHPNADLMVIRANLPHQQLDTDGDDEADQSWRLYTYRWTDTNRDNRLWVDRDHDGAVDHTDKPNGLDIDGNVPLDYKRSEIQKDEYVRLTYHNASTNSFVNIVRNPRQRMDDGIFVGFEHNVHNTAIDQTKFSIQIDFYENTDWSWLTHSPTANGSFSARLAVPPNTPYGMYEGGIVLSRGGDSMVVPVSVAVAAQAAQAADGSITGALSFGGEDVAAAQDNLIYNNGSVFGGNDWGWRAESGDWRFFFYDVPRTPPDGTLFLADTTWDDTAPFTDLDTVIFGRGQNSYQLLGGSTPFGAPYILDTVGKSENKNVRAGVWSFDTATGGAREVVTAPAQEGLHMLAQHQVGWQGDKFSAPFSTKLGSASVTPTEVEQSTAVDSGSLDVTFKASVDLDGLAAEGFGLSQPQSTQETAAQDDPDDPSSASVKKNLTLSHASRLTVDTTLAGNDIDLFVVRDANGDGVFAASEIVTSSATAAGDEHVELVRPADGNYQIWVHGFAVAGNPAFTLDVDAIQGNDVTVSGLPSGAVPAGTPVTIHVAYAKSMTAGQDYFGELLLGPSSAPTALTVPITIHRN